MTALATIIHLALPPLSILAMGRFAPRRGVVWTIVAGLALYETALLTFGFLLGYLGLLRAPGPLVLWSFLGALLLALAVRNLGSTWKAARAALAGVRPRPVDAFLGLVVLATAYIIGLQVARDWTVGTVNFDSLSYHIPRALLWSWHGDFRPWPAPYWQQVGHAIGGDVLLLPGVFLGIGWVGASWTTVWLSVGAAAAVFAAARSLGIGRRPSFVAALAFFSFPVVGMRLVDVNSDMAAAFPIVAAWALVVRARSSAEAAFLFPALCGVGVASKANVAPAVLVLAIALFGRRLRTVLLDWRALTAAAVGIVVAALFCAGSYLPIYRLFGDLMGGGEGRGLSSYREGPKKMERMVLLGTLQWLFEPFALVPESRRIYILHDVVKIERVYRAFGASVNQDWYPAIHPHKNRSGVFPLLALPWLLAALPKGRRLGAGLLFLAVLIALFAPINPNIWSPRFSVVLLAAFAVFWGFRAVRSPGLVPVWLLAALVVDAVFLGAPNLRELNRLRRAPDWNAPIAAAVGSHTLWLLNGPMTADAQIAGRRADVCFAYLTCPRDGDWKRLFAGIRETSPWLLLNNNVKEVGTGPGYLSAFGPPCPNVPVVKLQNALSETGWRLAFGDYGYQVWSAEPARQSTP